MLAVIVEASIACENVAVTVGVSPSCVAPSTGDVESTAGGTGGTVENVQFTAAGSGVSSSDRMPVVSRAVYAVPVWSALSGVSVTVLRVVVVADVRRHQGRRSGR